MCGFPQFLSCLVLTPDSCNWRAGLSRRRLFLGTFCSPMLSVVLKEIAHHLSGEANMLIKQTCLRSTTFQPSGK